MLSSAKKRTGSTLLAGAALCAVSLTMLTATPVFAEVPTTGVLFNAFTTKEVWGEKFKIPAGFKQTSERSIEAEQLEMRSFEKDNDSVKFHIAEYWHGVPALSYFERRVIKACGGSNLVKSPNGTEDNTTFFCLNAKSVWDIVNIRKYGKIAVVTSSISTSNKPAGDIDKVNSLANFIYPITNRDD